VLTDQSVMVRQDSNGSGSLWDEAGQLTSRSVVLASSFSDLHHRCQSYLDFPRMFNIGLAPNSTHLLRHILFRCRLIGSRIFHLAFSALDLSMAVSSRCLHNMICGRPTLRNRHPFPIASRMLHRSSRNHITRT
jgi:hypothetical protein